MGLLDERKYYKPLDYEWAKKAWLTQMQILWLPEEVPMADDVQDWQCNLLETEKNLLTQIFRFFTQADIDVMNGYLGQYLQVFKKPEISMMLTAFAAAETVHIVAYSHILDTVGMPEVEYQAFLKYDAMASKHEYISNFKMNNIIDISKTMAVYGAFTEGLQLFASFAMLLHFPRLNKMKGMGQIITWSIRDETLHTESIIKLFNTFVEEYKIDRKVLEKDIMDICLQMVNSEAEFINLAFEMGDFDNQKIYGDKTLTKANMIDYIRFIANKRLKQLGFKTIWNENHNNPLVWLEEQLQALEFTNFFENTVTEYSKAATSGTWEEAFSEFKS